MSNSNKFLIVLGGLLVLLSYFTMSVSKKNSSLETRLEKAESSIVKFHVERSELIAKHSESIKALENKIKVMASEKLKVTYYPDGKMKSYKSNKINSKDISLKDLSIDANKVISKVEAKDTSEMGKSATTTEVHKKVESSYKKSNHTLWIVLGVIGASAAGYLYLSK